MFYKYSYICKTNLILNHKKNTKKTMKENVKLLVIVIVAIILTEVLVKPMLAKTGLMNFENVEEDV